MTAVLRLAQQLTIVKEVTPNIFIVSYILKNEKILKIIKKTPPTLSVIECCNITTFTYLRTAIL